MIHALSALARPLLLALEPETAHRLAIEALLRLPLPRPRADDPLLAVDAFGLRFPNPVGMAAGFDKNAEVADAVLRLGFGFAEVGSVTPKPQPGNPPPRLFRFADAGAVINRFGFNSAGHAYAHRRLAERRMPGGIVGVNLGANKDAADRSADFVSGIATFADVASYFVVNVSSPNTPGLRDLQQHDALDDLVARALEARDRAAVGRHPVPVLLKIAPDLTQGELDSIIRVARARHVDGMIVSNTTVSRPADFAQRAQGGEAGGLSGRPLFAKATQMLAQTYQRVEGQFPLVGVGGIEDAETAYAKIEAGASLVQLYTALVFKGLGLVDDIKRGLVTRLRREGYNALSEAVGSEAGAWACGKVEATSAR
jgi:dihydroorotate dehydrogenase